MGILRDLKKLTRPVIERFLPTAIGNDDLVTALAIAENAGTPYNVVMPDFIGQLCLDTTNNVWYRAVWTLPAAPARTNWRPMMEGALDANGNIIGLAGAGGATVYPFLGSLSTANTAAAATANTTLIQAALTAGGLVQITTPGTYYTNDPLFYGPDTQLILGAGVTIKSNATYGHTLLRMGNADFTGDALAADGVAIIVATNGTAVGAGTLTVQSTPARLTWTAPGDTAGSAVNVSGADGRYTLTSANGKALHVSVARTSLPASGFYSVKVVGTQGSVAVTWSRTSNVTTVTEAAHTRWPGDCVVLFGTSFIGQVYVAKKASASTWTFTDSRGNSSGSGEAYGIANVAIEGGTWDANFSANGATRNTSHRHGILVVGVNRWQAETTVNDLYKYGVYVQGAAHWQARISTYSDSAISSSSALSIQGKSFGGRYACIGRSTDNLTALLCSDYPAQLFLWPLDEGGTHIDQTTIYELNGDQCKYQLCRLVGALNQWIRNTKIYNVGGSVDANTSSIVASIVDSNVASGTETNIDGLLIDGLSATKAGTTSCSNITMGCSGTVASRGFVFRNISPAFPAEINGGSAIAIQTGTYEDITVENCSNLQPNWQGNFVSTNLATGTIERLTIQNVNLTIDNALKNTGWRSAIYIGTGSGIAVRELNVINCSVRDNSAAGSKAYLVNLTASGGSHAAVNMLHNRVKNCQAVLNQTFADASLKIRAFGINMDGVSYCCNFNAAAAEIHIGGIWTTGTINSAVLINFSSAVMKIRSLGGLCSTPTNGHVYIAGGSANSPDVNGADLVCDTTKLAAITGNLVRSSATSKVAMYDGAAWTAIA